MRLAPLLLLVPLPQAPAPATPPALGYEVTLAVEDAASGVVQARARLAGLAGPLELAFPERFAFLPVEPRLAAEPRARTPAGAPLDLERLSPFRWRLDPGPATEAVLSWGVVLDHRRLPDVAQRGAYEFPYLASDHGLLVAAAVLLAPAPGPRPLAPTVRFELPEGWAVHAPWIEPAPGVFAPDPEALGDDLVAIGAWDVLAGETGGLSWEVVLAPGQGGLAALVAERLPPIVEAQVDLFGGAPQPRYLFVFGRPDQERGYGGSPKHGSMTLFVSADLPLERAADGLTHLVAHEFHHTWMKARCAPRDELRFLVEGFTDYYAHVVPWRLGFSSDEDLGRAFADKLAEAEAALAGFGADLASAGGPPFFQGGDAYRACYAGGLALALWTDLALRRRAQPSTLDALLRAFYGDPRWRDGTRPDLEHWSALLAQTLGPELAAAQRAAVRSPAGIDWCALFDLVGIELGRQVAPLGGGPRANFDGTSVLALDPAGAGALAGLRIGDRLLEVNGVPVADAAAVHAAWDRTVDGHLRLVLEREGRRLEHAAPPPSAPRYALPADLPLPTLLP